MLSKVGFLLCLTLIQAGMMGCSNGSTEVSNLRQISISLNAYVQEVGFYPSVLAELVDGKYIVDPEIVRDLRVIQYIPPKVGESGRLAYPSGVELILHESIQ
jgi:hypothetical protein